MSKASKIEDAQSMITAQSKSAERKPPKAKVKVKPGVEFA
jgi:hypothetical protein